MHRKSGLASELGIRILSADREQERSGERPPKFSIHALSDLIRKGENFDLIFVDGNHRFDDVIVDFYLSDQILLPRGLIVFDDMGLNSVRTATNFILHNRSYEVVRQPVENMLVLRKTRYDYRDSTHFNTFEVLGSSKIAKPPSAALVDYIERYHAPPSRSW
jgi:Methyltransferase domain